MRSTSYFNQQEIDSINNEIADIFGEEGEKVIKINLSAFYNQICKILKSIELIQYKKSKNNKNKYKIKNSSREKRKYMGEAYLLIHKFRSFLLNESINYRYYYQLPDGTHRVTTFTESNIIKYMRATKGANIALSSVLAEEATPAEDYQNMLDQHMENILKGVQISKTPSLYVVHSNIMNRYGNMNPGLKQLNSNRYQLFNYGHIYEAADIAFSDIIENEVSESIEYLVYGKYLSRDSVAGTKGGDNFITNTQIKSGEASIINYSTIIKDLTEIKKALELDIRSEQIKNEISKTVKDLFLDSRRLKEDLESVADKIVDKLLEELENTDKNKTIQI